MKIGIVGNGGIVKRMLRETEKIEKIEKTAICVRKESLDAGYEIAAEYGIPEVYSEYDDFLVKAEFDFAYIAVINSEHYNYVLKALQAGRHVICEKPFTATAKQLEQLMETAKAKGLFLFEAMTINYSPNYLKIKEILFKIGQVKIVQCNFSQYSSRYHRYRNGEVEPVFDPQKQGGALYDLNVYNIHFVVGLFGVPESVAYYPNIGFNGVDTSGIILLKYPDFVASCVASKDTESKDFRLIQGEDGTIESFSGEDCRNVRLLQNGQKEEFDIVGTGRFGDEFAAFASMLSANDYDTCYQYLDKSLEVMKILEKAGTTM